MTPPRTDFQTLLDEQVFLSESSERQILHIEDDSEYADLVATFLEREREQFQVITETDPEDGLETLAEHDIDCVVCDFDMPKLTELEVVNSLGRGGPRLL